MLKNLDSSSDEVPGLSGAAIPLHYLSIFKEKK